MCNLEKQKLVLNIIENNGPLRIAEICRQTGLSWECVNRALTSIEFDSSAPVKLCENKNLIWVYRDYH